MPTAPRAVSAPWITAAVTAAAMIAAILVYFLIGDENKTAGGAQTFNSDERGAVAAAGTEAANLVTFRRAHFAADFNRALAGATGALRSDIQGKRAVTLKAMTQGKFDLGADVQHTALVGPADGKTKGYVVLVSLNGYRSTQKDFPTPQNLQVTVVKKGAKWLASDLRSIAVSQ